MIGVVLVFLASALHVYSQQTCCSECLKDLQSNSFFNVRTYTQSVKNDQYTGFCAIPFKREGACCDQADALQYTKNWLKSIKAQVNSSKILVSRFQNHLQFVKQINEYVKRNETAYIASGKITKEELDDFKNMTDFYSQGVHNFQDRVMNHNKSAEDCYKLLFVVRANSVCLRCSGFASNYWNTTTKIYNVTKDTCKAVMTVCAPYFGLTAEVTTFYRRLAQLRYADKASPTIGASSVGFMQPILDHLRVCALSPSRCNSTEQNWLNTCHNLTFHIENVDLEGDSATIEDGTLALEYIAQNITPGKTRLLEDVYNSLREFKVTMNRLLADNATANATGPVPADPKFGFVDGNGTNGADLLTNYNATGVVNVDFKNAEAYQLSTYYYYSTLWIPNIALIIIGIIIRIVN